MKILFLIDENTYGGAPKMMSQIANATARCLDYEIIFYPYLNDKITYPLDRRIRFIKGTPFKGNYLTRHFIKLKEVVERIGQLHPDLIISFMPNPNVAAIFASRKYRIPVIISERGDPRANKSIFSKIKYGFYKYCSALVCQIPGEASFFSKRVQKKTVIIPNSISIEKKERACFKDRENSIAFVGRFQIKQKRQDLMIKIFNEIAKEDPFVTLDFYGDGADEPVIKAMVKRFGLDNRVIFHGAVNDLFERIFKSKVYVLTSDYEGIPNSLIEAMALGIPCVSFDCKPGGARFLINNGINGILVGYRDVCGAINAIRKLLNDEELSDKLGMEAQRIICTLNQDVINRKWVELIERIVEIQGGA